MDKIIVKKSPPLSGVVQISGAKNAALPILAACLMCDGTSVLENVPALSDVEVMCEILRTVGAQVERREDGLYITPRFSGNTVPYAMMRKLRGSFLVLAPLLTRLGSACISLPGGCPIGVRPIDLHLKGLATLGAQIEMDHGVAKIHAKQLVGNRVYLDFPSVGATENVLMAAVLAEGNSVIVNAAAEPEIESLAEFLNQAGAKIKGAGTSIIHIEGVRQLEGVRHCMIPDRIEAGTFMTAAAITRGKITLDAVNLAHLKPVIAKFRESGIRIEEGWNSLCIDASGEMKPINIKTLPFPGFPTDMQAQMTALMSICEGTSTITETVFENRFLHVSALTRMGADIRLAGRCAIVEGVKNLSGAKVEATDLRGGAALVLAGLAAKGDTEIGDIFHIERGYENFTQKLAALGANIAKVPG